MTGSKTNSSSCKLNITGKAGGGLPGAGGEGRPRHGSCHPQRGRWGLPTRGGGAARASAFCFPFPRARRLNPLLPAASRLSGPPAGPAGGEDRCRGGLIPGSGGREPAPPPPSPAAWRSPRARPRELSSCFTPFPAAGSRAPSAPRLRDDRGTPGASGSRKVARGGPGAGASQEAARAPGLSRLLLPSQPQSGVRQAGEREDGDAAPLRDGERRPRAWGGGGPRAGVRGPCSGVHSTRRPASRRVTLGAGVVSSVPRPSTSAVPLTTPPPPPPP